MGTWPDHESSQRRRVVRVRADLKVVVAYRNGTKLPARVMDISVGGMHLRADRLPEYGEPVTVIVQLSDSTDWHLLPGKVRWFSRQGFGVEFDSLDGPQANALARFVDQVAA